MTDDKIETTDENAETEEAISVHGDAAVEEEELRIKQQEEELKVKQRDEELKIKQKGAQEEEDEKNEGVLEHEPEETGYKKFDMGEFEPVKDQDISQYLWDTLLKYTNKGLKKVHDFIMNEADHQFSKREHGPDKPRATKEEKMKNTKERGKELYDKSKSFARDRAASISDDELSSFDSKLDKEGKTTLKDVFARSTGLAYEMAVSELMYERMSKDKDFKLADMNEAELGKDLKELTIKNQNRLLSGITATAFYSENIEGMSPKEALKACDEYLKIRENESNEAKKLITTDLENGNFAANDKKPSRETATKINALRRSFDREVEIVPSSIREVANVLEKSSLSDEEKVSLQEFQKTANIFQKCEANSVADLRRQVAAVNAAYQANKNNPIRDRIAAMKAERGVNPISKTMSQKFENNTILRAATQNTGRK